MLSEICLENWKSYRSSKLYFDPVTILIGTNASGKSNALDALQLLNRLSRGINITSALAGDVNIRGIRGGLEWACLKNEDRFSFVVVSQPLNDDQVEYHYKIEIEVNGNQAVIYHESLKRITYRPRTKKNPYEIWLFQTGIAKKDDPYITARLYNGGKGSPRPSSRSTSILSQLYSQKNRKIIEEGVSQVILDLNTIFILDPIPSHMRDYAVLSDGLEPDASNVAGVLAALDAKIKDDIEATLTKYAKNLPEKDIVRVYAETVGKFNRDAMLYCDEGYGQGGDNYTVDARGMSDGSLRFIGILTALLTRPENSLLIVEEIDNGLHPSRSSLLVNMLKDMGSMRSIDILVTTHNPALLDASGPEMIPFITVAHRDEKTGQSKLTLLEDVRQLPKLLAAGPVGKLTSQGRIEKSLHGARG